jgi:hypothetical protein
MREINIEFPPRNHSTLNHHPLQDITLRSAAAGVGVGVGTGVGKRRESTYILKQKFATIRRSMVLMGENKENALRPLRYDH